MHDQGLIEAKTDNGIPPSLGVSNLGAQIN